MEKEKRLRDQEPFADIVADLVEGAYFDQVAEEEHVTTDDCRSYGCAMCRRGHW